MAIKVGVKTKGKVPIEGGGPSIPTPVKEEAQRLEAEGKAIKTKSTEFERIPEDIRNLKDLSPELRAKAKRAAEAGSARGILTPNEITEITTFNTKAKNLNAALRRIKERTGITPKGLAEEIEGFNKAVEDFNRREGERVARIRARPAAVPPVLTPTAKPPVPTKLKVRPPRELTLEERQAAPGAALPGRVPKAAEEAQFMPGKLAKGLDPEKQKDILKGLKPYKAEEGYKLALAIADGVPSRILTEAGFKSADIKAARQEVTQLEITTAMIAAGPPSLKVVPTREPRKEARPPKKERPTVRQLLEGSPVLAAATAAALAEPTPFGEVALLAAIGALIAWQALQGVRTTTFPRKVTKPFPAAPFPRERVDVKPTGIPLGAEGVTIPGIPLERPEVQAYSTAAVAAAESAERVRTQVRGLPVSRGELDRLLEEVDTFVRQQRNREILDAARKGGAAASVSRALRRALNELEQRRRLLEEARKSYIKSLNIPPQQGVARLEPIAVAAEVALLKGQTPKSIIKSATRTTKITPQISDAARQQIGQGSIPRSLTEAAETASQASAQAQKAADVASASPTSVNQTRVRTTAANALSLNAVFQLQAASALNAAKRIGTTASSQAANKIRSLTKSLPTSLTQTRAQARVQARARPGVPRGPLVPPPPFLLPSGARLPRGVFPDVVMWNQGNARVTYSLAKGTVFWARRTSGSPEPDKSFKVVTTTKTLPRARLLPMGLFKVRVTRRGLSFHKDGQRPQRSRAFRDRTFSRRRP